MHAFSRVAMRTVVARAPTRIDFGGGWTDVPPYTTEQGGCVCNVAISRAARVRVRACGDGVLLDAEGTVSRAARADALARDGDGAMAAAALRKCGVNDVHVEQRNDFPRGAGLGGSSAAGVALMAALSAWRGEQPTRVELAERSRTLEIEELAVAGGSQDHYAAAFGGALALHFDDCVSVQPIRLADHVIAAIEHRCIVAYTGQSRISGETITAVLDAYRARVPRVTAALARMRALAEEMILALGEGNLDALAALVDEHWTHQRSLHERISTPAIERVLAVARAAGALGGKALGASGGGSVLVIAPSERADAVRAAVAGVAELLPFAVDRHGAQTSVEQSA